MFKKSFVLILGLFVVVLAGGYFLGVTKDPRPQSVGRLHKPMPPLDLPLLENLDTLESLDNNLQGNSGNNGQGSGQERGTKKGGEPVPRMTPADFKGRQVLLHFFASWCKYCRDEHSTIQTLADQKGILLYGINIHDRREDALAWLSKVGNPYDLIGFDEKGMTSQTWGVMATPQTFVIDKAGIVVYQHSGSLTPQRLKEEILPLFENVSS